MKSSTSFEGRWFSHISAVASCSRKGLPKKKALALKKVHGARGQGAVRMREADNPYQLLHQHRQIELQRGASCRLGRTVEQLLCLRSGLRLVKALMVLISGGQIYVEINSLPTNGSLGRLRSGPAT